MPRHIIRPKPGREGNAKLVAELAKELRQAAGKIMPYILEEEVAATGLRTATVIWDRWKDVPERDRADVILAAYEVTEDKRYAESIAIPTGLTPHEALALGYLPYKVQSFHLAADGVSDADLRRNFAEEAARTVLGKAAKELRYPRSEDAHEAFERLQAALPVANWGIVEELLAV